MTSLMSSQAISFILPLITYPYIIRTIGLSHFGEIQFVLAIVAFFGMLTDFGYNYSAPREVARLSHEPHMLSELVSRIFTFKILIFMSISVLVLIYSILTSTRQGLLTGGLIFLLNLTLTPNWFFQGVEKMEFIAVVDILAKLIFTGSVFFLINTPEDYIYILPLWGLGGLISGLIGVFIIIIKYRIRFIRPNIQVLKLEIGYGYSLFILNLATQVITSSQIVLLGVFQNASAVGTYAIAEKIIKIPWTFASIFSQALYPRVCKLNHGGNKWVIDFYKQILPLFYFGCFILLSCLWFFSDLIVGYFTVSNIREISHVLKILIISVAFVLCNVPSQLILLANGKDVLLMRIFILTACVNAFIASLLIYHYSFMGAAISSMITMGFLLTCLLYWTRSNFFKTQ